MSREINQATVVITGASSGIGRAIALAFAKEHANLVLAGRNESNLMEIVQECQRLGGHAVGVPTDTTDPEAMEFLAKRASEAYDKGIDVWVNSAGIGTVGEFSQTPLDSHVQVVRTNLIGYMNGCFAVLPYFKERGRGVIINLNSLGAFIPLPYASGYSASKFGLLGFMESLRGELSRDADIHICDLYPSMVDTPGYLHAGNYTGTTLKPMGPMIAPEEVAKAAIALARNPRAQTSLGWPNALARVGYTLFPKLSRNLLGQVARELIETGSPSPVTEGNIFRSQRERGRSSDGLSKIQNRSASGVPALPSSVKVGGAIAAIAALGLGLYFARRKPRVEKTEVRAEPTPELMGELRRKLG